MLLRNRSRAVTKPGLMADHSSQQPPPPPPNQNYAARRNKIPSLFGSPKLREFTNKCCCLLLYGTESLRSPTSILEHRALFPPSGSLNNPSLFSHDNNNKTHQRDKKLDSKAIIGLAIVGVLKDAENSVTDKNNSGEHNNNSNVLFGIQLRSKDSTNSGIYAKVGCGGSGGGGGCGGGGVLSLSEMELCEEYTRVTSHGPNPRTTHIFNNCILEGYFSLPKMNPLHSNSSPSASFLSFCYTCKKNLDHTKDIFIYRGEKAFCSTECRHKEMELDGVESL